MLRSPAISFASLALAAALTILLMTAAHGRNHLYRSNIALWQAAVQGTPGKQRPLHNLGHALVREGRYDEALQAFGSVLRMREDGSVYMPFLFIEQGNAFFHLGRLDEAIASWHRALASSPGNAEVLTNIAVALLKQGRKEEARGYARSALAAPEPPAEALEVMGEIALDQGAYREAASYLTLALKKKPDLLSAYRNAALALEGMGDYRSASAIIQQYPASGPKGPDHKELLEIGERLRRKIDQ